MKRKVNIDFKKNKITNLAIISTFEIPSDVYCKLIECLKVEDKKYIPFAQNYSINKRKFFIYGSLERKDKDTYELLINYDADFNIEIPKGILSLYQFIDCFSLFDKEIDFNTKINFQYNAKKVKSRIELPYKIPSESHSPFDDVRGMRFVKYEQDNPLFFLIVDFPTDELFIHTIGFNYLDKLRDDLIVSIVNRAREISSTAIQE